MTSAPRAPHVAENMARLMGKISLQGHLDELAGSVKLLAAHPDVDPRRIFALANSEGCIHALNYQVSRVRACLCRAGSDRLRPRARWAPRRAARLPPRSRAVPGGEALLAAYDQAMADFAAGRPMKVDENLPEGFKHADHGSQQPCQPAFRQ